MKCPVCDQETSSMCCPSCGFDASRDYGQHPTFGPVAGVSSAAALRRDWLMPKQELHEQIESLLTVLLAVQYRKIITASPDLRNAKRRIQQLEQELAAERKSNIRYRTECMNLEITLRQENLERSRQVQRLEHQLTEKAHVSQESDKVLNALNNRLKILEQRLRDAQAENTSLRQQNQRLQKTLESTQSKNAFPRFFKR